MSSYSQREEVIKANKRKAKEITESSESEPSDYEEDEMVVKIQMTQ